MPLIVARTQKLKVYRTPIGFHDAYVAAPSQKAALEAWGSDANLFARGAAELVTDEALMREPLDHPGEVIKRLRGSVDEQLKALGAGPPRRKTEQEEPAAETPARKAKTKPAPKPAPRPRPSRAALDKAERDLAELVERQAQEEEALRERERALVRERRELDRAQARDRKEAERALEREREAHSAALDRWIEDQR